MKKTISILLVLVLVAVSAFATPTIGGRFGVKYTYTYGSGDNGLTAGNRNYMTLTDSNDYWSIYFGSQGYQYGTYNAYATLNLDKMLADAGLTLPEELSLSADIGVNGLYAGYAYIDAAGNDSWYLPLATESTTPFGLTVGYKGWSLYAAAGLETDKKSFGVSVQGTVTDGVDVQAAYSQEVNAVSASFGVDVAKLASLDFALSAGAYAELYFDDMSTNKYVGGLTAGFDALSAYAEFISDSGSMSLNGGAGYKFNKIFSAGISGGVGDFSDAANTWSVGGYAQASLSGVATRLTVSNKKVEVRTQFNF
ncbi:MAG: hypothetical protein WC117_01680 [Sphaerochaetaceae bacterium]